MAGDGAYSQCEGKAAKGAVAGGGGKGVRNKLTATAPRPFDTSKINT
jgi:hypothetical protein